MTAAGCLRSAALLVAALAAGAAQSVPAGAPGPPAAQDPTRVPVGLVLAGGGARGGAHIGALQVLEELRVPVDYIAGTSMGSIVGALYAVGYTPAEMEEILGRIDWESLFRDQPDRKLLSFRRKVDDRLGLLPFEIGVGRRGFSTKGGVTTATKVEFVFQVVTLDAAAVHDFDDLRIPYRAVAADLATGDPVVLDHGILAEAMRASMAIPGVFTPSVIDGRVLVDGGIADNLPVDVARGMGARRVIAIDVGTPPKASAHGLSSGGVLGQTMAVISEQNVRVQRASLGAGDLMITPDLEGIGAGSFDKIGAAVAAGAAAARLHAEELRAFSVSEEEYRTFLKRQRRGKDSLLAQLTVDEIEVRGVPGLDPSVITRRMETRPGQVLDPQALARDLARVNRAGEFQKVGFRVEQEGGRNRLVVEASDKSWGPGYLRAGIRLETNLDGDADFALLGYYRRARVNRLNAEWKNIVSIGTPLSWNTELYQPFSTRGLWFVAPSAWLERQRGEIVLPDGTLESVEQNRAEVGADLGLNLRSHGEVRLGLVAGQRSFDPGTTSTLEGFRADSGAVRLRFTLDKVDNVFFPTVGNTTTFEGFFSREGLGATARYDRLLGSTLQALTLGRNTFIGWLSVGTDLDSDLPPFDEFELGGFLNLSGFKRGSLRGDVMGLASLVDYVRVGRLGALGNLYAGLAWQAGNTWDDVSQADLHDLVHSGTLFFGVDSRIAPVYLGYGIAEGGEDELYVFIGRAF